jgi:hypothetical protein
VLHACTFSTHRISTPTVGNQRRRCPTCNPPTDELPQVLEISRSTAPSQSRSRQHVNEPPTPTPQKKKKKKKEHATRCRPVQNQPGSDQISPLCRRPLGSCERDATPALHNVRPRGPAQHSGAPKSRVRLGFLSGWRQA